MDNDEKSPVSMEGNLQITDLFGLGKAAEKLSPVASKVLDGVMGGIAKGWEPISIYANVRAEGKARRDELRADMALANQLGVGFDPAVAEAMKQRLVLTEYRRQENITKATRKAVEYADRSRDTEPVDVAADFVTEWIEGVKDVSHEQLQEIWAKLLANAPSTETGRIPKPAVDLLRLFDGDIATEFEHMVRYSYPADYILPARYVTSLVSDFAEEIGVGTYQTGYVITTALDWLHIEAEEGTFNVFRMGARARALAETLLTDADEAAATREFVDTFVEFLSALSEGTDLKASAIVIRDSKRRRNYFTAHHYEGQLLKVGLMVPGETKAALEALEVSDDLYWPSIQKALLQLADQNLLLKTVRPYAEEPGTPF